MRYIARTKNISQIKHLKDLLYLKNTEVYRIRYYTNSFHHSVKLRLTQALAFLYRLDPEWDDRILHITLTEANQSNVTHINELIFASTVDPFTLLAMIEKVNLQPKKRIEFFLVFFC